MTDLPVHDRATLFFEPLDVLHFRDHRPFDAGLHTHAKNVFPMPSVFLGCLRTALLTRAGASFDRGDFGLTAQWAQDLLGSQRSPGTLSLRGPFLARRKLPESGGESPVIEAFFPIPLDLRSPKKNSTDLEIQRTLRSNVRRYHGPDATSVVGAIPWSSIPKPRDREPESTEPKHFERDSKKDLLSLKGVHEYLKGVVPAIEHRASSCSLYRREPRVGIVRSDTYLTADDHLLYATEPFRFCERAGLAVEVDLPSDPEGQNAIKGLHHAIVPLGGKGHQARIHYRSGGLLPAAPTEPSYKLWLVTPLVLSPELTRWPAEITCAAGERTEPVGGFDLAKRAPKPLRQALPAGTVLRVQGLTPDDALQRLAGAEDPALNSQWKHDRCAGFGVALVAKEATHP